MILDLDRQYRESSRTAGPERNRRWKREFGLACVATVGGFASLRALAPGVSGALDVVRDATGDVCLFAARIFAELTEADAVAIWGLILGLLLVLATVHAAERQLDRSSE